MRTLLLLRGAMGSGKSTWVKENHLENYTLSADDFRLKITNPVLNEAGEFRISQKFDTLAWNMLMQCLEERMKQGHFTVIDATHNNRELVRKYEELAAKYRYQIYIKQFDVPLEVCLERNNKRDEFKRVPEESIRRAHMLISETSFPKKFIPIQELSQIENYFLAKPQENGYKEVKIIGDIQGCYTVLMEALGTLKEDTLYVFLGDLLDRGIENRQVMDWFLENSKRKNVILIEGNHEAHWFNFANDAEVKPSKSFLKRTLPELLQPITDEFHRELTEVNLDNETVYEEDSPEYITWKEINDRKKRRIAEYKQNLRNLHRLFRVCYFFEFNGQKYLCTHAGLTSVPKLTYISAREMIHGVGGYETPVGEIYEQNYLTGKCQDTIQFHGHRNVVSSQYSYCLEDSVEFGGNLVVATVDDKGITIDRYKNNVFTPKSMFGNEVDYERKDAVYKFDDKEVESLVNSRGVNVKVLEDNILSINFKESIFRKQNWTDISIKARGLFIDRNTGEVVARSYNKFFNFGELQGVTDSRALKENLVYPLRAYRKENGFLGMVTVRNDEFWFASKSTNVGQFRDWLKELFDKEENVVFKQKLFDLLKRENATAVFEVIHNHDHHMVDYQDKEHLYLLDIVKNETHLHGCNVDVDYSDLMRSELTDLIKACNIVREKEMCEDLIETHDQLLQFIEEANKEEQCEGYVIVDATGFCFKLKGKWYSDWKRRRGLVHYYISHRNGTNTFKWQLCKDEEDIRFMKFVTGLRDDVLEKTLPKFEPTLGYKPNINSVVEIYRLYQKYLKTIRNIN